MDEIAADAAPGENAVVLPADVADHAHAPQLRAAGISQFWKDSGTLSGTGAPARSRRQIADGLMGTKSVVDGGAPEIAIEIKVRDGVFADARKEFEFESSVDAFDFALSLRVARAAMQRADAQADQTRIEP